MSASEPLVIQASSRWRALDLRELWRYRELVYFFVWRDVKIRYKQTILGIAWIVFRPVLSVVIFTVVFGHWVKMPSEGMPYPLFVMTAMVPWNFFAGALGASIGSLVSNSNLITKVYFPRLAIPIGSVLASSVDIAISFALVIALMIWYGVPVTIVGLVEVAGLFVLAGLLALGTGLWLGAINVKYRDVGNAIPFLVQVWMYATPVVYPLAMVPSRWRWAVALNPVAGIVEGFRSSLFSRGWDLRSLMTSIVVTLVTLVTSLYFFRASERGFVDSL